MKKRTKIGLGVMSTVVILVIIAGVVGYQLTQGTPSWYHPHSLSREAQAAAARSADNKFLSLVGKAADAQAAARRTGGIEGSVDRSVTVSFSSDELNAFFYKWVQLNHWSEQLDPYLADPQIALKDGQIILAGKASWAGLLDQTVVSIHFSPRLTPDNQLALTIDGLWAGRLPLPDSIWNSQKEKLVSLIHQSLPSLQQGAHMDAGGTSNADAVAAMMSENLLKILKGQSVPPVIFLPVDRQHGYPMELSELQVKDKQMTLGARPLDQEDLSVLRRRIEPGK